MDFKTLTYHEIQEAYQQVGYHCSEEVAIAIKNAAILNKPIILEGPPGVGKTELAKATAALTGQEFIRLQCSPEMNEKKALYDFNYSKQMMFIQLLKEQLVSNDVQSDLVKWIETFDEKNPFYSKSFLVKRPIMEAFCPTNGKPKVLLIDELDKADAEFEFSLLEAFSDYTISIPEIGTIEAEMKPLTIITSNRERKLTDTMLRRCIYVYLEYPSVAEEEQILVSKTKANKNLAKQIATLVASFREMDLVQKPSIAESMEWAEVLSLHCPRRAAKDDELIQTVSVIAKTPSDQRKIKEKIAG